MQEVVVEIGAELHRVQIQHIAVNAAHHVGVAHGVLHGIHGDAVESGGLAGHQDAIIGLLPEGLQHGAVGNVLVVDGHDGVRREQLIQGDRGGTQLVHKAFGDAHGVLIGADQAGGAAGEGVGQGIGAVVVDGGDHSHGLHGQALGGQFLPHIGDQAVDVLLIVLGDLRHIAVAGGLSSVLFHLLDRIGQAVDGLDHVLEIGELVADELRGIGFIPILVVGAVLGKTVDGVQLFVIAVGVVRCRASGLHADQELWTGGQGVGDVAVLLLEVTVSHAGAGGHVGVDEGVVGFGKAVGLGIKVIEVVPVIGVRAVVQAGAPDAQCKTGLGIRQILGRTAVDHAEAGGGVQAHHAQNGGGSPVGGGGDDVVVHRHGVRRCAVSVALGGLLAGVDVSAAGNAAVRCGKGRHSQRQQHRQDQHEAEQLLACSVHGLFSSPSSKILYQRLLFPGKGEKTHRYPHHPRNAVRA